MRDPDNLDFRPKSGSKLIANAVGPYGQECMEHGGVYWIPGRQQMQASMPIPPSGTTTAKCDADLMWLSGYGAESHDLYFGTDKSIVSSANSTSSHDKITYFGDLKVPTNVITVSNIKFQPGMTYYWRVDARISSRKILNVGPVWDFQCKS